MTKIIHRNRDKIETIKNAARELLGNPRNSLLTAKQRQTLERIAYKVAPSDLNEAFVVNAIAEKFKARAAA